MELSGEMVASARENRMVMTNRDITMMFEITGHDSKWFQGKDIMNLGAGKSHWGLDLTRRYGVVAKRFENFDLGYAIQNKSRRIIGKALLAETAGDLKEKLPHDDESFDLVWNSITPEPDYLEIWRVLKPGGEGYVVRPIGEESSNFETEQLRQNIGLPETAKVEIKTVDADIAKKHSIHNSKVLVIRKQKT